MDANNSDRSDSRGKRAADVAPRPEILDHFLTRSQLAALLGVSERTLQRWQAAGDGPPRVRIGKIILYRTEAVRGWLAANETRSTERPRSRRG